MKRRVGIAVVMVLVVLLLIEGMAAGMLALANHTRAAADAQLRTARADAAAYLAARTVLRNWEADRLDTLAPGALDTLVTASGAELDASWSAAVERLQPDFVIRAQGRVGSSALYSQSRVTLLARTLDRSSVLNELNAALTSGGPLVLAGSTLITARDSLCAASAPTPPSALLVAAPPTILPGIVVNGAIVVDTLLAWSDSTALGNASWSDIAAIADRTESGILAPVPAVNGAACDTTALANWGDPLQQGSPCAAYFPLIFSPRDLTMASGQGQGILVVAGVLSMDGNASFKGAVLARDGLVIGPNAKLVGAALSRRGYALIQDAAITHSLCELQNALNATRATRRLLPQRRRFLPTF